MEPASQRRRVLVGVGVLSLAACPPLAETAAAARVHARITCADTCGALEDVDVDVRGLRLDGPGQNRQPLQWSASSVTIAAGPSGIEVDVNGLEAWLRPRTTRAVEAEDAPVPHGRGGDEASVAGRRMPRTPVPILVRAHGFVRAEATGATLTARDPTLALAPDGEAGASFHLEVEAGEYTARTAGPIRAHLDGDRGILRGRGALDLGGPRPVPVETRMGSHAVALRLGDPDLGQLHVEGDLGQERWTLWASAFPLVSAGRLVGLLPDSVRADVTGARLSGRATVTRSPLGVDARLDDVVLENVEVLAARLSRDPVQLRALGLHGDLWRRRDSIGGQLVVSHDRAQALVSGEARPSRMILQVDLPATDCQTLVDSMPPGTVDMIRGIGLRGEVAGHLRLDFDPDALRLADPAEGDGPWTPPGQLDLTFPFIERCRVEREPPRIDLPGLAGPYRHHFLTDGGQERRRTMAPGAPDFVPLANARLVARALVTLEDTRFFLHDGFDRDQIEKAFWHNLGAQGFRRGASTITQQTARNLWLGIDRSIARKLQEALLASRLEVSLSKPRILELYINLIELGPEVYGVAEAARYHFGKQPAELTVLEAIYLASLAPAPRTLSLRHHQDGIPLAWVQHLRRQARRMAVHGHITWPEYRAAARQQLRLAEHGHPS